LGQPIKKRYQMLNENITSPTFHLQFLRKNIEESVGGQLGTQSEITMVCKPNQKFQYGEVSIGNSTFGITSIDPPPKFIPPSIFGSIVNYISPETPERVLNSTNPPSIQDP
jgi:hypothetical protein